MPELELLSPLRLDPWAASSLLQKAIRRGETLLARQAAQTLYRQRGVAVFRRLATIAVEDIGIGDGCLVQEISRIASDKALRLVLGTDEGLIDDLCVKMAGAIKDRSADYLYSDATLSSAAKRERVQFERLPDKQLIEIASDLDVPLRRRAVAALAACTTERNGKTLIKRNGVYALLKAVPTTAELSDAVCRLAETQLHPFCLLLPLIQSAWLISGAQVEVSADCIPQPEFHRGIPSYIWDKHTAVGKQAISMLVQRNVRLREKLATFVPDRRWNDVTGIAAFYVDATPVARSLEWNLRKPLNRAGFLADMLAAGCDEAGADDVLTVVRDALPQLNQLRRAAAGRSQNSASR